MRCIAEVARAGTKLGSTLRRIPREWSHKTFEYGTWGGEIRRELRRNQAISSGFANTYLGLQLKNMASISSPSGAYSTYVCRRLLCAVLRPPLKQRSIILTLSLAGVVAGGA